MRQRTLYSALLGAGLLLAAACSNPNKAADSSTPAPAGTSTAASPAVSSTADTGGTPSQSGTQSGPAGSGSMTASAAPGAAAQTVGAGIPKVDESKKLSIGFFGFAKANSFALASYDGVEEYAKAHNATAEFVDPNFDAQTQVNQLQDAVTSKRYDIIIVQANDGTAVVPPIKAAVAAGITVVVEFTPIGTDYSTTKPQVPGTITLINTPVENGVALGNMGIEACKSKNLNPCNVAYLEGFKTLPLDNARTKAVLDTVGADPSVKVVADVEGGYTQDAGRKAMQDILQAHPDVNVVMGSSQAIAGAAGLTKGKDIMLIGNGGSRQAIDAVKSGQWYGTWALPAKSVGAQSAALGLAKARGGSVSDDNKAELLAPNMGPVTAANAAGVTGEYDE